ncbi:MAG TPA: translocation/assembly module TamB domain-containing protein, partial [Terriglobales bacterium]|nr:translocation/assembly module TamB domain-containing protein [Terriglobales bacterium]
QLRDYDFDAWLRRFTLARLSGHSHISGSAALQGPLAEPDQLTAQIALDPVELALSGLVIHNQGPIQFHAAQRRLTLLPAHLVAEDTDFTLEGAARMGRSLEAPAQLQGQLVGHINLALLQSLHPATRAAGQLQVNAQLAGTTAQPQWRGQIAIQNASLAEEDLPIGFDNIQGQLQLAGSRVQIVRLSAHTGSGTLELTGFAAHTAAGVSFDVQAKGQNLRLRYQGISTTGDLQLRLSGQPGGALLAGDAQLNRVGLDRDFDLALFIASTQAAPTPPNPDSVLNHVHMDIHLVTGPQVVVATNLAHLQLQADLHLRGTLAEPAVLGRASASEGRLLFAGNEYQVTKAQVQFVNPFRIEPLLDVGLSTTVQQYDVTLNLAGPADKLAITYRSDPPLSSSDVMALLATGQPTQATSTLNGASNYAPSEQLLGQALDNLVAGRLQRLFGITQVQVNPDTGALGTTGSGGTVTVQQQVSRNLKLTYTQNLSSSSQDIIQVDWTISRFLGITLSRDQFGLYGLKFTFRHRAR